MLNTLAVGLDPETEEVVLGIDDSGWYVAESIVIARCHLFSQIYFHKTRRAYDYHLKEALKNCLLNGKLPALENLDDYLDLDDTVIWTLIRENKKESNCDALLNRNHIRMLSETPDVPEPGHIEIFEAQKSKLVEEKIWLFEDESRKTWYRWFNIEKAGNDEIMIISEQDRTARPLSEYSVIAKAIKETRKIRLYVKGQEIRRAKEVIGL